MVGKRGFDVPDAKYGSVSGAKHGSFAGFSHEGMHGRSTSLLILSFSSLSPAFSTVPPPSIDLNSGATTPGYPY
jgi:hypothetical protein